LRAALENDARRVYTGSDMSLSPLLRPFAGLRPAPGRAAEVAAPPYDVVSSAEARALAVGKPWSFLHVSKPEIDLPEGTDPYAAGVYAKAAENMRRLVEEGVLVRDAAPAYYAYRIELGGHVQSGIAGAGSVAAYTENRIRRHELTRSDKENDRVRQIEAVGAHTGPVLATHRPDAAVAGVIGAVAADRPSAVAETPEGAVHSLWVISGTAEIAALDAAFDGMDAIYIADGHHRSAAAAQIARDRPSADRFLVVTFPEDEVRILDYNRVVKDLDGLAPDAFLDKLSDRFEVAAADAPVRPERSGEFGMYFAGQWRRLVLKRMPGRDAPAVSRLDVSLLTHEILEPVLAIGDIRTDPRIDFVGGGRGLDGLQARVDGGEWAVAFSLFPTSMSDVTAVADAGAIMPPKSTWFDPKLADGMVSLVID
jgi:uncharacterized protein (DUF1015 family)